MDPLLAAYTLNKDKALENLRALNELLKFSVVSISSLFFPLSYAIVGTVEQGQLQPVVNLILNMLFIYLAALLMIFIFHYAKYIECRYLFSLCLVGLTVEDIRSKGPQEQMNYEKMANQIANIILYPKDRVMNYLIELYPLKEIEDQIPKAPP
jgi:hypothetical protein